MQIDVLEATRTLHTPGVFIEKETGTEFETSFQKDGSIICDELIECYTFTSKSTYSEEQCLDYSTRISDNGDPGKVSWGDGDISESKDPHWIIGTIICLVIPCSNGKKYLSYQKILERNILQPLRIYNIQNDNKPFMVLGKNKKLYFNEFVED